MQELPHDVLRLVSLLLPVRAILDLSICCRSLSFLRADDKLWSRLLARDYEQYRSRRSTRAAHRYRELRRRLLHAESLTFRGDYRPETVSALRRLIRRLVLSTDSLYGVHDLSTLISRMEESDLQLLYCAAYNYDANKRSRPHDLVLGDVHRQLKKAESANLEVVQTWIRSLDTSLTFSAMRLLLRIVVLAADEVDLIVRAQASLGKPTGVGVRGIYPALVVLGVV